MKKRLLPIALVASVLALSPRPAAAQVFFDNYCVAGSFWACASVRVFASGNQLSLQVWNLEGVIGSQHSLSSVGVYHLNGSWNGAWEIDRATYVTETGANDITSFWTRKPYDIAHFGDITVEVAGGSTNTKDGVIGCTDPGQPEWLPPGTITHFPTCQSFPGIPYVQIDFTLSEEFALDDIGVRWRSQQLPDGSDIICDTATNCNATVVPEPITVSLLATGLAGVGGVKLRRKKKLEPDPIA